ncbi:MAG: VOC family protein [Acidimicrobiales bacterium]|nr:VOC family protein [Acidimicrobiales bacterium]
MPAYIVLDTQDPEPLVDFYCKLQGIDVLLTLRDGQWTALTPNREGLMLVLQQVPEPKVGKNRAHFDVVVDELDAATAEVERLGGRWLEPGRTHELEGFSWRCMADPEGNEFCLYLMAPGMNNDAPLPH